MRLSCFSCVIGLIVVTIISIFIVYSFSLNKLLDKSLPGVETIERSDNFSTRAPFLHKHVTRYIPLSDNTINIKQVSNPNVERTLPQGNCGLILFYHINQCAGGSLGNWFQTHASGYHLLQDIYSYLRVKNESTLQYSWNKMIPRATAFIKKVSARKGWKVLELHHGFPGVYYSQKTMSHWL